MPKDRPHVRHITMAVAAATTAVVGHGPAGPAIAGPQPCATPSTTAAVDDGFPGRLSGLVGADIRTGRHECFERVVVEFAGTGDLPGYRVGYQPDPILDSPAGEPVEVAGVATLVISLGAWMPSPEGDGYSGPREIVPDNVSTILELEQVENFEGMSVWAIGLDGERPFTVFTLGDPARLVVDIALDNAGPAPQLPATR